MTTRLSNTSDLWWKNAVIYCVDIETYFDSDGDGVGDIAGLTQRVDYLAELGVTCLWLMPSTRLPTGRRLRRHRPVRRRQPAGPPRRPRRADPHRQRPRHPVIADLVVNHLEPAPVVQGGPPQQGQPLPRLLRLRPTRRPDTKAKVVFPDKEDSIWELDEKTGEWYLHHFYKHQPDLNFANPAVRDEIAKSIGFWLRWGSPASASTPCRSSSPTSTRPVTTCRATRTSTSRRCGRSWAAPRRRHPAGRGQPPAQGAEAVLRRQRG